MTGLLDFILGNNPLTWLWESRNKSAIRALAYHEIDFPENFERHLNYFKSRYNIIGVEDLELATLGKKKLPEKPLLITFDDAERSVYQNGLPLFIKFNVPACLFVVTRYISTKEALWWQALEQFYEDEGLWREVRRFKKLSQGERLMEIKNLETSFGRKASYDQLTLAELLELQNAGVCIANHTHTHPLLDQCSKEEIEEELTRADSTLKRNNLNGYRYFAFPNGNYNPMAEEIFKNLGIQLAFLFDHMLNREIQNRFQISRLSVNSNTSLNKLRYILSGLHSEVLKLYK